MSSTPAATSTSGGNTSVQAAAGLNPNIVSGLISGMNWTNTVNELIANERQSMEGELTNEQTANSNQISSLNQINSAMTGLESTLTTLNAPTSSWFQQTVSFGKTTSTSTSAFSATTDGTTPLGQYTISVTQPATQTTVVGSANPQILSNANQTLDNLNIAVPIDFNATDVNGNNYGQFTINGDAVDIYSTDTLQDVFNKISTATNGAVTATLSGNKVTLTDNNSSPIVVGSSGDTTNFLQAMELYTQTPPTDTVSSTNGLGSLNPNTALVNAVNTATLTGLDSSGNGSFTINGQTINFNINTDSVGSIMNDIDQSGAGVLASFDPGNGQITLQNTQGGSTGIALNDSTGLLSQLGLTGSGATTNYGQNCEFTVNGGETLVSNSNTITPDLSGIEGLTVTVNPANATGTPPFPYTDVATVANSTSNASSMINNFISSYNDLNAQLTKQTQITTNADGSVTVAPLSGNDEVTQWQNDLSSIVFQTVNTGIPTVSSIYQIGLDFNTTTGALSIVDQTAFDNALSQYPDAVAQIFNTAATSGAPGSKGGIGQIMNLYLQNVTKSTGDLQTDINTLNSDNTNIQNQLEADETKISADQAALVAGFQAMEAAMAQNNQDASEINSVISGGSG